MYVEPQEAKSFSGLYFLRSKPENVIIGLEFVKVTPNS
jgi:hypothetical protein